MSGRPFRPPDAQARAPVEPTSPGSDENPRANPQVPVESLLKRMRAGDREAAAEFMLRYAPVIRRRFRSLVNRIRHPLLDSDDVFATIARRLDELVLNHALTAASVPELWALIRRVTENRAADSARSAALERRIAVEAALVSPRRASGPGGGGAAPIEHAEHRDALASAAARLEDRDERLMRLRVTSRSFAQIARLLGIAVPAARKRWQRITRLLRATLAPGLRDPRA